MKNLDIGNFNKYNAYRLVADDYTAAVDIMKSKKLGFGEPAVVPFYYPDKNDENRKIRLMLGLGSIDGNIEIFVNTPHDPSDVYIEILD